MNIMRTDAHARNRLPVQAIFARNSKGAQMHRRATRMTLHRGNRVWPLMVALWPHDDAVTCTGYIYRADQKHNNQPQYM